MLWYLGQLATLRKANISGVRSVCLSVCPHGTPRPSADRFTPKVYPQTLYQSLCGTSKFHQIRTLCMNTSHEHFALTLRTNTLHEHFAHLRLLRFLTSLRLSYQGYQYFCSCFGYIVPIVAMVSIVTTDSFIWWLLGTMVAKVTSFWLSEEGRRNSLYVRCPSPLAK